MSIAGSYSGSVTSPMSNRTLLGPTMLPINFGSPFLGSPASSCHNSYGIKAPHVTPLSGRDDDHTPQFLGNQPNESRLQSHLWNTLTGREFRTRIIAQPQPWSRLRGAGSPNSFASGDTSETRTALGYSFPLQGSPVSYLSRAKEDQQKRLKPLELLRALETQTSTAPISARTDASVEKVFPEFPRCASLTTDMLVIECNLMKELVPEVEVATKRVVEAVNFIKRLYASAARVSWTVDSDVWTKEFDQFLETRHVMSNAYEEAVTGQLEIIRDILLGIEIKPSEPTEPERPSISSGNASTSDAWFEHVARLKPPGPLQFAGPGCLTKILCGKSEAIISRERDAQLIADANGGLITVDSNDENIRIATCYSAQIIINGTCRSLYVEECDNCCISVSDVQNSIRVRDCAKIQLVFLGACPPSVIYE